MIFSNSSNSLQSIEYVFRMFINFVGVFGVGMLDIFLKHFLHGEKYLSLLSVELIALYDVEHPIFAWYTVLPGVMKYNVSFSV